MNSRDEKSRTRAGHHCLLKGHSPLVASEVFDSGREAQAIIASALEEADRIVKDARAQAEGVVEEERTRAREVGKSQVAHEVARALSWGTQYEESLRGAMVDAVLAVAKRVWGDLEVERSNSVARVAREISDEVDPGQSARFRVHPHDRQALESIGLMAIADPALSPGDCVAEVGGLVHDARASVRASLALEDLALSLGRKHRGGDDEW